MNCAKCFLAIKNDELLKCATCVKSFHYNCAEYNEVDFRKVLPMNKPKLKCIPCKNKKSPASPAVISHSISSDIQSSIVNIDLQQMIKCFDTKFDEVKALIKGLEISFGKKSEEMLDKISQLTNRISTLEDNLAEQTQATNNLHQVNEELRAENRTLKDGLDEMDQRARLCNIEIQNLPEKKGENLIHVVETIGKVIGVPIPASCITDVHRVAHNQSTQKAKNVIVHLSTKRLRDDVIAASRSRRGLTASQVQAAAAGGATAHSSTEGSVPPSSRIYINEHLTLRNKILYAKTRARSAEKSYKYTWVKNAAILVRKDENSRVITVRRDEDLQKLN